MEQPQNVINRKVRMTEVRNEIKGIKDNLFKKTAVMRGDDLRAYLDHLRYAENMIRARDAQGKGEATMERPREKYVERKKENTENSTEEEPVKKVKNVEKKVKGEIKEIKKEMKKEKAEPKKKEKLHKEQESHLDKIPKALHSLYKKHLKYHDGDHLKANKAFKSEIKKMK